MRHFNGIIKKAVTQEKEVIFAKKKKKNGKSLEILYLALESFFSFLEVMSCSVEVSNRVL